MGSMFGGGGGGSPPTAPPLRQVDTSMTGPLYKQSAAMGDRWAALMRGSYGLGGSAGPPSWQAKYLGPGALAMMKQSGIPFAGGQDPQVAGAMKTGFGDAPNLGTDPYQVSRNLGQQFKAPLGQLQRNQSFQTALEKQWQPPNLRLTGEDLLNVKMQQMTQNAQAQQAGYAAALQGSSAASQAQSAATAAEIAGLGKIAGAGATAAFSPSLSSSGYYQPSPFASMFGASSGPVTNVQDLGAEGVSFEQGTSSFGS